MEAKLATFTVWPDYGPDRIDPTETVVAETVGRYEDGAVEFLTGGKIVAYYAAVRSIHRAENDPQRRDTVFVRFPRDLTDADAEAIRKAMERTLRKGGWL